MTYQQRNKQFTFQNKSGERIPPYACMQINYAYDSGKSGLAVKGNDVIVEVTKPTGTVISRPASVMFNGAFEIEDDDYGEAVLDPVLLAYWKQDTGDIPNAGDEIGPKDGEWFLTTEGEGFLVKSFDSSQSYYLSGTEQALFVERVSASGDPLLLYKYTLTQDMTANGATADFDNVDGNSTYVNGRVFDIVGTASHQVKGDSGLCLKAGDYKDPLNTSKTVAWYVVIEPECNFELADPANPNGGINPGTSPISAS